MQTKNKKYVFIIIGCCAVALFFLLAAAAGGAYYYYKSTQKSVEPSKPQPQEPQNNNKIINLTESNDGEKISLKKGDKLKITLRDPGDGGYVFSEPQYEKSILKQIDYKNIKPTSGAEGDFGSDEWVFEVINKGNTILRYDIYRPWESKEDAIKDFEITVNVDEGYVNSDIILVSYGGQVFSAKIPKGWTVTDNESGIDIMNPADNNTGASGAVAVGWYGESNPDAFIEFMASQVGLTNINYLSVSDEGTIKDPITGFDWVMKTKTFTCNNNQGISLKMKVSAGVINGYGQYIAMLSGFQTTPDKWDRWAPILERIASSIMITNPQKAGGIDKVRLPSAKDLANDSSPLMEAWEYRNQVEERTSHEFSDAIMGHESDLVSHSTGQSYTLPLSSYDPTIGGYRNPDNSSEVLFDPYQ